MIKTIVVDDEIWVIKLIRNIVNWDELGYCIVGDADNCEDALKLIEKEKPQLLLTDIRIPGNDGLYLIRMAKEKVPDINVIVVSGYGEFEYAKAALNYGAYSYLLKPVDRDELSDILSKLRDKILNEEEGKAERQERIRRDCEARRQRLLQDIAEGALENNVNLRDINAKYCTGFCEDKYAVLAVEPIFAGNGQENAEARESLEKELYNSVDERLLSFCGDLVKTRVSDGILMLINYNGKNAKRVGEKIKETYKILSSGQAEPAGYRLIIGKSGEKKRICDLREACTEASEAKKFRIYTKNAGILQYTDEYKKVPHHEIMTAGDEKRLRRITEICKTSEVQKILEEILMPAKCLNPEDVFSIAKLALDIMFQAWRPQIELIEESGMRQDAVEKRINNSQSIEQIISTLSGTVEQVRQLTLEMQRSQPERITARVKSYIQKHYMEKLTLEAICGSLYLSPQYVCSVFKQQEGITILDYITDYRIAVAKELLLNNRYQINDVMLMVGYNDAKYFVKVFRKKTGVTPSEYRKMFI